MGKQMYYLGIFLGLLCTVNNALRLLLYLRYDFEFYTLPSFFDGYNLINFLFLLWLLVILAYHYHRKHKAAFSSCILLLLASGWLWFVSLRYFLHAELKSFYFPSYIIVLLADLLYSLCLVFSVSKKIPWLKSAGVCSALIVTVQVVTFIGYLNTKRIALKTTFEDWHNRFSWAGMLVIVLVVVALYSELKKEKSTLKQSGWSKFFYIPLMLTSLAAAALSFYIGQKSLYEKPVKSFHEYAATTKDKASAERFDPGIFVNYQNDSLRYRLLKPLHYDSSKTYPLVLCLHGGAGWGTDNIKQVEGSLPAVMLSNYLIREQHPAFLFVPQISGAYSFGGRPNLKVADDIVVEALQFLETKFKIDKSRLYMAGNSLGAYGVWHFAGKYPKMFAAAIPISGEGDIDMTPEMVQTAIWAFHGKKDINVPVSGSQDMVEAIRLAGGNPRYSEYPNADHDIWKKVINTPGLADWLFANKKNED